MGFFNKRGDKKAGIPELPELPSLPEISELPSEKEFNIDNMENQEKSSLPSYPNTNLGERINESAIKDAVTYGEPEITQKNQRMPSIIQAMPQIQRQNRQQKMQKRNLKIENQGFEPSMLSPSKTRVIEIPDNYESENLSGGFSGNMYPERQERIRQIGPLFIQLNKFEESIATLDEIKLQISEIESLLRSIQEVKNKEEEKLIHWSRQIESIKAQIDNVDKNLFGSIQ